MKKINILSFVLLFLVSNSVSNFAKADDSSAEQWAKLPDAKKEEIRNNYKAYQKMTPDEKTALDKKYETYKALPPAEKQRLQKNYAAFKRLPPTRQQRIRTRAQTFETKAGKKKRNHRGSHNRKES